MVLLHFKKSDTNQFLYESVTSILVKDLIIELVQLNNTRLKLDRLAVSLEDLANVGPQKPEELRGLQDYDQYLKNDDLTVKQGVEKLPPRVGTRTKADETHHRTGWVLEQSLTEEMMEIAAAAKKAIHKNQVDLKKILTMKMLEEHIQLIRGVVMKNYPGYHGLGDWEPVRVLLEDEQEKIVDKSEEFNPEQASLWFAGKELLPTKVLSDYSGKNEKSKIILKLQKKGSGAPQRQPLIDEATHKSMLSYYHKKQEEAKKLQEDNQDNYMNSPWADPKGLKNQLHGVSNVSWK